MGHTLNLNREETPSYTIEFEDGTKHTVDPFEVVSALEGEGVMDDNGNPTVGQKQLVEKFRDAIGLPSLSFSDALIVMQDFERYVESVEKKLLGSPTSQQSMDGGQSETQTKKPGSGSGETSEGSARKSA